MMFGKLTNSFPRLSRELQPRLFIDRLDTKLFGLVRASSRRPDPATTRSVFFETERGDFGAEPLGLRLGLVTRHTFKRTGEDHRLAGDRARRSDRFHRHDGDMFEQRIELVLIMFFGEEIGDGLRDDLAEPFDIVDLRARFGALASPRRAVSRRASNVPKWRARRRALVSPTWRMPSAKMKRLSGNLAPRLDRREEIAHRRLAIAFAIFELTFGAARRALQA